MPRFVGSAPTQTGAAAGNRQQRFEPGVGVDLDGLLGVAGAGREQITGHVPRGDAVVTKQGQAEMDEVLAHAGAPVEQIANGRVDVGGALAVLEPVGDQLGDQA